MATQGIQILVSDNGSGAQVVRTLKDIGNAGVSAGNQVDTLSRALSGLAAYLSVTKILAMADAWTLLTNKLQVVTTSSSDLQAVSQSLLDISSDTRTSMSATANLYSKLAIATVGMGYSQQELLDTTKGLNEAFVIGGSSAQQITNGIRELSLGMDQGSLDGKQLKSIIQQLPVVADVLAQHFNMTRGALIGLGQQGKITPEAIVEAFQEAQDHLGDLFAKTLPTFGQAWQILTDRISAFFGQMAQSSGAEKLLGDGIAFLVANFNNLTAAILSCLPLLTAWLAKVAITTALELMVALTTSFGGALVGVIGILGGAVVAWGLFNDSMDATFKAMDQQVSQVDRLVATWAAAKVYIQDAWADFPKWFGDLMQKAMDLALTQFAKVADFLPNTIKSMGDSLGGVLDKAGVNGNMARNMFGSFAGQFKNGDDIRMDVAGNQNTLEQSQGAHDAVADASLTYAQTLASLAKDKGKLGMNPGGDGGYDTTEKVTPPTRDKTLPQTTFNDEIALLERQNELLQQQPSEIDGITASLKVEDTIKKSITDRDARRAFTLPQEQSDEINNLVNINQRLKDQNAMYDEIQGPQDKYWTQTSALNALYEGGKISLDQYNLELAKLDTNYLSLDRTIGGGVMRGMLQLHDELTNLSTIASQTLTDAFKGLEDALVSFVTTGKLSVTDLVNSVLADFARLAIRQSITGPLSGLLTSALGSVFGASVGGGAIAGLGITGVNTTTSGSALGSFAGLGAAPAVSAASNVAEAFPVAFANGGDWSVGGSGGTDSQHVQFMATPGEQISVRKPGQTDGSGSGGVTMLAPSITIVDNVGAKVSTSSQQNSDGSPDITVFIDQITSQQAADIRKGQGKLVDAISTRFGVAQKPGGR